jgi:GNAT superfamily N-acetyltransferase
VRIVEVGPADESALRVFSEIERAAHLADRPYAVLAPLGQLRRAVQDPSPYHRRVLLLATVDGEPVGTAHLGLSDSDNQHLGDLEVAVLPTHRRRGTGRMLYEAGLARLAAEGRTVVIGEAHAPLGRPESPSLAFARAMGCRDVHSEDHLVLSLPVDPDELRRLRTRVGDAAAGYELVTWGNRCPEEHAAAFCAMNTQMGADVPLGEVDYHPVEFDEDRLRTSEERASHSYQQVVAVARRRSDGVFGGYSTLYLPHDDDQVLQDDTLVMPEHRGHRLGLLLKSATLEVVQRDHPGRVLLHTWTSPDNHAMHVTNLTFGFRPVERLHEMQRPVRP